MKIKSMHEETREDRLMPGIYGAAKKIDKWIVIVTGHGATGREFTNQNKAAAYAQELSKARYASFKEHKLRSVITLVEQKVGYKPKEIVRWVNGVRK